MKNTMIREIKKIYEKEREGRKQVNYEYKLLSNTVHKKNINIDFKNYDNT